MHKHIDLKHDKDDEVRRTSLFYDVDGHAPVFRTVVLIILAEFIIACAVFIAILIR